MFKKFKDKLAEEVKSSPQRIQQFAQAAQAAVTSASSSISDITNNDLFSIGDNDATLKSRPRTSSQQSTFHEVSLLQAGNTSANVEAVDFNIHQEENQRQRRLSNSSFASDVSFRLPSYESPSMYHLQSDMEVSASEAEEKGFSGGMVNLDRVTKEQLYSAYRRTQDRCTKYKTQYADLARHYKLLERENAKARNVLVETQDKALRRISELREQCSLEQSAKAHLEKALQLDIEEKNMKIDTLNTKLKLLQNTSTNNSDDTTDDKAQIKNDENANDEPLITLATETNEKKSNDNQSDTTILSNKIEKLEQLVNKYKESLKTSKEKNAQLITELQIITTDLDNKVKEIDQLKAATMSLAEARKKIQELNENNEELQNNINSSEFSKQKEMSILELNLKKSKEENLKLRDKIDILSKREEEYAISLAENKLSIHKELESKEAEIKKLKDSLAKSQNEINSLNIIINDYKQSANQLEDEHSKMKNEIADLHLNKEKVEKLEIELKNLVQKHQTLENIQSKADEEYKCLQLQLKQETAEKLAMIDRNVYLENRNSQVCEENTKKSLQINNLESELELLRKNISDFNNQTSNESEYTEEINMWKLKYSTLESEIQDERIELEKLQSEIEKLLRNHELVQEHNKDLNIMNDSLRSKMNLLEKKLDHYQNLYVVCEDLKDKIKKLKKNVNLALEEWKSLKIFTQDSIGTFSQSINLINQIANKEIEELKLGNLALRKEVEENLKQKVAACDNLELVRDENNSLKMKIETINSDHMLERNQVQNVNSKHELVLEELDTSKKENENLNEKINVYEKEKNIITEKMQLLNKEIDEQKKLTTIVGDERELLKDELSKITNLYKEKIDNLNILSKEHEELLKIKEDYNKKAEYIFNLERNIDELKQENITLRNLSETISKSVTDIEIELKEVRLSHTQIELEKNHLSSIIEKLEKETAGPKKLDDKIIQTDTILTPEGGIEINSDKSTESHVNNVILKEEIQSLKNINGEIKKQNEDYKSTIEKKDQILEKYKDISTEYDLLKDENRRLKSDIEGLQTHMTKVSKENSQLNDKIRELIASSENIPEKKYSSQELDNLTKDKIESLIRENSLLADENLELKDQIKSQTVYTKSQNHNNTTSNNVENVMQKYNNLLETNNKLEKKLNDLEVMNQSTNGNMQQIQVHNEKLKLSNEKLERRLDEALVSLRHLHSLQENTELEYLKNILYEYLTGTGTHSITLAKVLSAVVKFDDRQTEMVLQKEKERQGFLRQLGII